MVGLSATAGAIWLTTAFLPAPACAQITRADTAAVLLDAARGFEAEGRLDLAEQLLTLLSDRYADTDAGHEAEELLAAVRAEGAAGRGHAGYVVWSTIFGAWMGIAVPAALGAEDPEPFGVGLLLGTPVGFFASRAYGSSQDITVGASRTITYAWMWGTWQAMGWRDVLDLGEQQVVCGQFGCSTETDPTAPWVAAVVGGLGGYAAGVAATRAFDIDPGTIELVWHSSVWGTGYGFALGFLADLEDDDLLASSLVGGNLGLLAAVPTARLWQPTSGQVRLISVAGLAGAVAGLGVDLLVDPDDEKTAVAIPTVGATIGLIGGSLLVNRDPPRPTGRRDDGQGIQRAILQVGSGTRFAPPLPTALPRRLVLADGREKRATQVAFRLVEVVF